MKRALAFLYFILAGCAGVPPKPHQVPNPQPLPVALDRDFSFRKTIQYYLEPFPKQIAKLDESVGFERSYRVFGAITALDQRDRFGNYYTFFWRAQHRADVTVRLEYRQEKTHAFTQAREVFQSQARGTNRTVFAIIGDDYANDGRVIAWRASLIVDGRVVAINKSYLWE
ncbi:MAG: hypothetical protein H0X40_06190 [Chthoniobacterales bacterium]|nr:hypothetical protein [Chthoniobacterales bacterium]